MPVDAAVEHFHGILGLNCAQAVLKAFQETHAISDEQIAEFRRAGGGRADEDGTCGALYAACQLLSAEHQQELREHFATAAGSTQCQAIKQAGHWSCRTCVAEAAAFVAEQG